MKFLHNLSLVLPLILVATALAADIEPNVDVNSIWDDPVFQKQFIASYGINSEVEPRITPEELKILDAMRTLMADNMPQAEIELEKQITSDCSAILDFTLGGIRFQQSKFDLALGNYQTAVAKFPSFRRAYRNIGLIYIRLGKFDEAIKSFTKLIELGGSDKYAFGLLGFAYASKNDFQAAEAAYRNALLLEPDNMQWRLGLTRCVFKQQKYEDAANLLNALIEREPEKPEFWILQAHTYLGMKQPLHAAESFEALFLLGNATANNLYTLGDIYLSEQLHDLAAFAYIRAIDLDPAQPVSKPLRSAEALAARGAIAESRQLVGRIQEVLVSQIDDVEKRKLLKIESRLAMAAGASTSETAAVLEEIISLDPLDGEALILLGQHYSRQGEHERAILYFERAAGVEAFEYTAKVRHAQTLVNISRYSDALPLLRRAQELKPREDMARYVEQIERLARNRR